MAADETGHLLREGITIFIGATFAKECIEMNQTLFRYQNSLNRYVPFIYI